MGGVAESPTRDNNEENHLHQVGRDVTKGRFRGGCVFVWYCPLSGRPTHPPRENVCLYVPNCLLNVLSLMLDCV